MYWSFNADTVAVSPDNISWQKISIYGEAGNVFTIQDFQPYFSCGNDLGIYHFSIIHDTLRLTLVDDDCAFRAMYDTTHYFVDFPIGVNEVERYKNVSVYPVPFSHCLNIKTETGTFDFTLRDISGRKVREQTFEGSLIIDTETLEPGMYLYELRVSGQVVKSGTTIKY